MTPREEECSDDDDEVPQRQNNSRLSPVSRPRFQTETSVMNSGLNVNPQQTNILDREDQSQEE
jgi:hypothetical protein